MAKGLPTFARKVFDTLLDDHSSDLDVPGTLIALYDVHTSCAPTGISSQAHTTIDPSIRSYYARAYKFTRTIEKSLEGFAAREIKPLVLSIDLDGLACKVELIPLWLKRSPPFTLMIWETELVYGMDTAYFPQHNSGFYYGLFESHDLLAGFSTGTVVDDGVKNLLAAWKACQDWKDYGQARNGRLIEQRSGDVYKRHQIFGLHWPTLIEYLYRALLCCDGCGTGKTHESNGLCRLFVALLPFQ